MSYKYYSRTYYSTVCHILEFNPKEFRLDVSLGIRGKLETLPKIAGEPKADEKVIAKMNASFFGMDGKSGDTYSTLVDEGLYYHPACAGYPTLIFWKDYTMTFEEKPDQKRLAYYQANAFFAIGIGWTLVIDGKTNYTYDKETLIKIFGHPYTRNPRTMIGQKEDGTIVMVVTNGRGTGSSGLTTTHMSDIMLKLGCKIAANMDGGGSSELNIDGKTINRLQGNYHRKIGTAFIVYGSKENTQVVVKEADNKYKAYKLGSVNNMISLNVRTGPGTSYSKIGTLAAGTKVSITGTNSTGKWYRIKTSKMEAGWVSASYITITEEVKETTEDDIFELKTTTANLHLRAGRGVIEKSLCVIPKGTKVEVSELKSNWYRVKYGNLIGYSYSRYLK